MSVTNSSNGSRVRPPLDSLTGRVAFITGGSSGIGLGIAEACALSGMKVAITYLTDDHLEHARERLNRYPVEWLAIKADVTDRDDLQRAADDTENAFGHMNLLVGNAGVGIVTPISEATIEDWEFALSVNLGGVINAVQVILPRLRSHRAPAHIVSTASMSGLFHGANAGVYTTTKFAVVGMMEALRAELAPQGIGVSAFCPGFVRSRIYLRDRNRPRRLCNGNADTPIDDEAASRAERFMQNGMDPLECGRKVLEGVVRNDMYILTHPEYRRGVEERFATILAHFPSDGESIPESRVAAEKAVLSHPVYRSGRRGP